MKDKYYERLKRLAKDPNSSLLMWGYEASSILKEIERLNNLLEQKDKVIQELLERIANLERNIEEAREFLVHSSISLEDMERVDEIFGS